MIVPLGKPIPIPEKRIFYDPLVSATEDAHESTGSPAHSSHQGGDL